MTRRVATFLAAAVAVGGAVLAFVTPQRLVVLNEGFRVDYTWPTVLGAVLCALGLAALAVLLRPLAARGVCVLLALVAAGTAVSRAVYAVAADRAALTARGLTESARIAWPEVRQVQSDSRELQVAGFGDARIRIDTGGLRAHDRATLERTISRRVQESGSRN